MNSELLQDRLNSWKTYHPDTIKIYDLMLENIPKEVLESVDKLKKVLLFRNRLTTLPLAFGKGVNIEELDISGNSFDKAQDNNEELYTVLKNLKSLRFLALGDLKLHNPLDLLDAISTLDKLKELDFCNFKAGPSIGSFIRKLSSLNNITNLNLQHCNLHGFPLQLSVLSNLNQLDLSFNYFTVIPHDICMFL